MVMVCKSCRRVKASYGKKRKKAGKKKKCKNGRRKDGKCRVRPKKRKK